MSINRRRIRAGSLGLTLIELIVFIVIVSVALTGVLSVLNITVRGSADPMIRKQMLAIAEALMEEVQAQPFTYCAPTDANAATANVFVSGGTTSCATTVQPYGAGTTGGTAQVRGPFNNVPNYFGLATISPVTDISGTRTYATSTSGTYTATITITTGDALGPAGLMIPASDFATPPTANLVRIGVTVSSGSDSLTLEGYRARHSPNITP